MSETEDRIEQVTQEVRRDLEFRHGYFATLSPEFEQRVAVEVERRLSTASFPEAWRCRTCRWWTKPACQDCVGDFPGFGQCMAANPGLAQVTHDGELLTAPDFACIEWEAKGD